MIIYVIIITIAVVLTLAAILAYASYNDALKAILLVSCMMYYLGAGIFSVLDINVYRKNVEAVNVVATIEDKRIRTAKQNRKTVKKYSLYINCNNETDQIDVEKSLYDRWEIGREINGQKIYFTTGFTNINTYEYVWAF